MDRRNFIGEAGRLLVLGIGSAIGLSSCGQQADQLVIPKHSGLDEADSIAPVTPPSNLARYSHTKRIKPPKLPRKPYPINAPPKFKKVADFWPETDGLTVAQVTEWYAQKRRKKLAVTQKKGGQVGWYLLNFDRFEDGRDNQYLYVCLKRKGEERFSYLGVGAGWLKVDQDAEIMWLYHQQI